MEPTTPAMFERVSFLERPLIGIAGVIGVGKSDLATKLSEKTRLPLYKEDVAENPYLNDYYAPGGYEKYGFPLQVFLLNRRFKQYQTMVWQGKGGIQDRTIFEDMIFARVLLDGGDMSRRDYDTYVDLFNTVCNGMRKPNLIVWLDAPSDVCLKRIVERARGMEVSITLEYLTSLRVEYVSHMNALSKMVTVIKIEWSEFMNVDQVVEMVEGMYARETNVHVCEWRPIMQALDKHGSPLDVESYRKKKQHNTKLVL